MRLTRAQQQERTRAAVLAAAVEEFTEHGYAAAKVDRIAARADLTRGAVYSNFASKRSLYLAVLLASVPPPAAELEADGVAAAAEAFARAWLQRLPLAGDAPPAGRLKARSLAGVFDDDPGRTALAEVTTLEALVLARALEARGPGRRVRLAELILTLLHGASHLAQTAPGFGDPFDVAGACRRLAGADPGDDTWDPPHLPYAAAAYRCRDPWRPPGEVTDVLTGDPVPPDRDGLVAVLGTGRLSAAEEAVRAGRPVTVAVVTADPAESGALVRLRLADLAACLGPVAGPPPLRIALDDEGTLAAAAGVAPADDTEAAVLVRAGRIVARARGRGAAHAVAR